MNIISEFSFSLVVRINAIDRIRTRKFLETSCIDDFIIMKANDHSMYFKLLELTHPKNLSKKCNMQVRYVKISRKDTIKIRILRINNIVDRIIQLQFIGLLDPIIDSNLSLYIYSFRRGRSALQSIAFLHKNLLLSNMEWY